MRRRPVATREVRVRRSLHAAPERVRAAAREGPIRTGLADTSRPDVQGHAVRWGAEDDVVGRCVREATLLPGDGGTRLGLIARYRLDVPFFGWLFAPLVRRAMRRGLHHVADVLEARALDRPEPQARRPLWAPPDRAAPERVVSLAAASAALVVAGFAGSLLTQTAPYVAAAFETSHAGLGGVLAVTRLGTLLALVATALADRLGRRRVLLAGLVALTLATAASAVAPSLGALALFQVVVRGSLNAVAVVALVVVVEEAPEGARAYSVALAGLAGGAGFALGALALPLAEIHTDGWRWIFGLGGMGLLAVGRIARRLSEPVRFEALRAGVPRPGAAGSVVRGRLGLLGPAAFLSGLFAAPSFQLANTYLAADRGLGAEAILGLRAIGQGPAAVAAAWAGGRLAESRGRRPLAVAATAVAVLATSAFFLVETVWALAATLLVASLAGGLGGPAVATFGGELFPTAIRGRAGAALLGAGVAGSVAGLLLVGALADRIGLGTAVALCAGGPLIAALVLFPRLPEGRGRALDELSPPEG